MSAVRILIVDDDAWILKMVSTVLDKRGYTIDIAADGREALERVSAHTPDLVITDVMMPHLDGWALIRKLRARPETAFTPVIFLTALGSDDDRIRGFRLGADDYLPKPFRFEELDLRVQNALRRVGRSKDEARQAVAPQPGVQGSLEQLGLSALLMMLDMEKKSGVLVLAHKGETARLFVRDGRVVRAAIDGRPEPRGAQCVYHVLRWPEGRFDFSSLDVDMEDEVQSSTAHLLMEGARLIDEANRPDAGAPKPPAREVPPGSDDNLI
jgi:DNA-binding response OmpR family regulator